jgi:hypothetical protein
MLLLLEEDLDDRQCCTKYVMLVQNTNVQDFLKTQYALIYYCFN